MVQNKPLVSIVIPNFNNGKYITQCIESIERQTYRPIEIVIVDDVSRDNSREIIVHLKEKYTNIRSVFLEKNGGVSNARNVGFDKSRGDYICFLDPDDFFYSEDKIELEIQLIQKYLQQGKKIIAFSGVACVNEAGEYVENRGLTGMLEGNILVPYLARYKDDKHPRNELVDREAFANSGGFDTGMSFWEDDDLFIRLLFDREIYFTGKIGTAYRWKQTGLSHQTVEKSKKVIKGIQRNYYCKLSLNEKIKYYGYCVLRRVYNAKKYKIPAVKHQLSIIKHKIVR